MSLPQKVTIVEVGPRDGLQNEAALVPAHIKIALIEALADAGLTRIEAGSFVSPKWVPQMADSEAVIAALRPRDGVTYSALVPNLQGFARASAAGLREIAIFGAASETFSQKNINCSVADSLDRFRPVAAAARAAGIRVRGYVSCALGCPYEGAIDPAAVIALSTAFAAMGCFEISIGDTIGVGTPVQARHVMAAVADAVGLDRVAVHFHDTYGQALANILACLEIGVATIDSAVAGLGGCPYAKGATGNVATEDVLYMLHGMGIETGLDPAAIRAAGAGIAHAIGPPQRLASRPRYGGRVSAARLRAQGEAKAEGKARQGKGEAKRKLVGRGRPPRPPALLGRSFNAARHRVGRTFAAKFVGVWGDRRIRRSPPNLSLASPFAWPCTRLRRRHV